MPCVMIVVDSPSTRARGAEVPAGQYFASIDVDAHDGRGEADLTRDPDRAMLFDDVGAAMSYWRRRSTVCPTRPDGKPNRPGTAFTVEIITV